ncbi:Ig-like domain-containing protein [Paenibacillus sp. KQZ6P-2]|uniref:Ig-like domain-containing protein n=1 Tax=Paenibacillus mangrovi TaxID=2931978 RepID=A0A9X1WQE9_9BACL|nr:Ig-like domain-containing protein [Paenibacillus mangrovi]MCJ8012055.1 Ig-like domain-containing protein [Paenibacillus mangrovi]
MHKKLQKMLVMSLVLVLCVAYSGVTWAATAADLSKLVLSKSQVTLEIGDTASVTAKGVYNDNSTENVTIKANWSSANDAVATVNHGTITAVGEGSTTISVVYGSETDSVKVNVTKKVKALTKDVQKLDLKMSDSPTIHLTATYTDNTVDTDASNKAEWAVDDSSVVSVVNGVVKPIGPGTATITATYGKQTVSIPVSVELVKRLDPSVTQVSMLVSENKPVKVSLKATYPDGDVKNDVSALAEWSTSNPAVADVIKGEITAYGPGSATITAKYGTMTTTIQVDVDKTIRLQASEQNIFMHSNETLQNPIKVEAVYPDKAPVDITKDAVWTSSNEKVAFVKQGVITANAPGAAVITAQYGDKSVSINVDVDIPRHLDMPEKISLSLSDNKTQQLELTATYANGQVEKVQSKAEWKSSKEDVVYVSNGMLTAYKKGEADISATYGGVTVTTHVAVDMPLKVDISSKKASLKVGGTYEAAIILDYGSNKPAEKVTDKVEWSSSKEDVAKVDDKGIVTGVGTGTATITGKYDGKTYTMTVEVGLVSELTSPQSLIIMSTGEKKTINLEAVNDPENDPDSLNKRATWKSSSPTVASVDSGGVVTGLKSGKAMITAEYGGKKVTVNVEVDVISKLDASVDYVSLKTAGKQSDKTATVTVKATFSDGSIKDVSSKADWSTSNYKVASVTDGKITALSSGKTTVSVKYGNKTIRIPVEVDNLKYLQTNEVSLNMSVGQTYNLTATATYSDGSEANVSKPAVWKSSRILTATVKDGVVKATGKGKATITVTFGGKSTRVQVTVK